MLTTLGNFVYIFCPYSIKGVIEKMTPIHSPTFRQLIARPFTFSVHCGCLCLSLSLAQLVCGEECSVIPAKDTIPEDAFTHLE